MGSVVAGADVGGTKADVVVAGPGGVRRTVTVPSAAWYRAGARSVAEGLVAALRPDGAEAPSALVVGAHGCDSRAQCDRLQASLVQLLGIPVAVLNDAELALPAAGVEPGVGLISGTGSIAVGYDPEGALLVSGGWGGYLGDEGSGTGLLRDAARAAARAYDRGERSDPLTTVLMELVDLDDLRDLPERLDAAAQPTSWAALATPLFDRALDAGSALAARVLGDAAAALAELVVVLDARGADTSVVVAAGGVVTHAGWLRDALRRALAERLPASRLQVLEAPPVEGAVALAGDLALLADGRAITGAVHPRLHETLPGLRDALERRTESR